MTNLFFHNGNTWTHIPEWAHFFIRLGTKIANFDSNKKRLVIGLAIPTRAYCSVMTALGVVIARSTKSIETKNKDEHFRKLSSLEAGAPIYYLKGDSKIKGAYDGREDCLGEKCIKVKVSSNGTSYKVPLKGCLNIEISQDGTVNLPKKSEHHSKISHNNFLEELIKGVNIPDFVMKTQLECVIVGHYSQIKPEVLETQFSVTPAGSKTDTGILNNVLRLHQFLEHADFYRTEILKTLANEPPKPSFGLEPRVTIFDGADGFLKWRNGFKNSHWVVVLDRTESNFSYAADILNGEYYKNPVDCPLQIQDIPNGIEYMVFEKQVR